MVVYSCFICRVVTGNPQEMLNHDPVGHTVTSADRRSRARTARLLRCFICDRRNARYLMVYRSVDYMTNHPGALDREEKDPLNYRCRTCLADVTRAVAVRQANGNVPAQ